MAVVGIRHVGMCMLRRFMYVSVAVFSGGRGIMRVLVMPVVVPMRVLMLQRVVLVFVAVRLRQVQHHAGQHQHAAQRHQAAGRAVT
jgi:hypothetical protein